MTVTSVSNLFSAPTAYTRYVLMLVKRAITEVLDYDFIFICCELISTSVIMKDKLF